MTKQKTDDFGKAYDLVLYWYITRFCNFSCPQCVGDAIKLKDADTPEGINIDSLQKLLNSPKKIRFGISGGEPFLVKNIIEVLQEITKNHYFSMNTNLVHPRIKEMAEKIDPERVSFIVASAHMSELKRHNLLETYLSHALLLRERGFLIRNVEVAYPFIIKKVDEYRKIFESKGLDLTFAPFIGEWKGKKYPESYTNEQFEIFRLDTKNSLVHNIHKYKGEFCIAGHSAAVIRLDGKIYPCYQIYYNLGNMDEGVNLFKDLIRCPLDTCTCPFNSYEPYMYEKAMETKADELVKI